MKKTLWTLALAAATLIGVPAAYATPISFYNDASTLTTLRFTLGCGSATGDCTSLLAALLDDSPVTWSSATGQLFSLANSGTATETAFVNGIAGTTFATGTQDTSPGGAGSFEFSTSADYFLIKIGTSPNYALLHNLSAGSLDLFFTATSGTGSGFSHFTTFGGNNPPPKVPEPANLGMFGLGLLMTGLLALGLRRRWQ